MPHPSRRTSSSSHAFCSRGSWSRPSPVLRAGRAGSCPAPALGPVQRLHLALLVDTKHDCVFGRAEVKAHDRFQFLGKMRVIADLKGRGPMRLESMGVPDAEPLVSLIPTSFAMLRVLQCVAWDGFSRMLSRNTSATLSGAIEGRRPGRGASFSKPGRPFTRKRQRQRAAFCTEMARISAISRFCFPSATSKITRARSATRTSLLAAVCPSLQGRSLFGG